MRTRYITAAEADAIISAGGEVTKPVIESTLQVFPVFALNHLPAIIAGIVLGTLFITVVGGGAGLSLGMATILTKDVYTTIRGKALDPASEVGVTRFTIAGILIAAAGITLILPGSTINDLGFLSMGLRGTTVLLPLSAALFMPGRIDSKCVFVSIICSPLILLAAKLLGSPVDPLFIGMAASLICMFIGYIRAKNNA